MIGCQYVKENRLKDWSEIDWKLDSRFTFQYGAHGMKGVKHNQPVLVDFDESTEIRTYYTLPPVIELMLKQSFKDGERYAKLFLKNWINS